MYAGDKKKTETSPALASNKNEVYAANDDPKFYTVKKGDTAFSIAKKHNISMRQLMDWNDLNFESIKQGQKLRVKP